MKLLLILTFILTWGVTYGQPSTIDYTVHSRVDTSNQEIREMVGLWANYLASKPDSIYDNPYWNEEEKKRYKDFDFTRAFIYQFPSQQLLNHYKPTILSIEKEGDHYAIKTLFYAEGLEGIYRKSNPWCITKLYAVKESNQWRLKNALPILTKSWERKTVGQITFIYPPEHLFNDALAQKANNFCNRIVQEFQFPAWKPFDYYITRNGDELGKLLGFDFFFTGYTTGMGMNDRRILLSGFGSEWYPHEFVHMILEDKERHGMINEGFATWQGGAMEKTFEERAEILAQQLAKNDTITFLDVLNKKWGWQYMAYYTTGAVLCKSVYDKGGIASIQKLLNTPPDNDKLVKTICDLLEIKETELNKFWRDEISKYTRD